MPRTGEEDGIWLEDSIVSGSNELVVIRLEERELEDDEPKLWLEGRGIEIAKLDGIPPEAKELGIVEEALEASGLEGARLEEDAGAAWLEEAGVAEAEDEVVQANPLETLEAPMKLTSSKRTSADAHSKSIVGQVRLNSNAADVVVAI